MTTCNTRPVSLSSDNYCRLWNETTEPFNSVMHLLTYSKYMISNVWTDVLWWRCLSFSGNMRQTSPRYHASFIRLEEAIKESETLDWRRDWMKVHTNNKFSKIIVWYHWDFIHDLHHLVNPRIVMMYSAMAQSNPWMSRESWVLSALYLTLKRNQQIHTIL